MGWKIIFSFTITLIVVLMLVLYWFIPLNTIDFGTASGNSNFSLNNLEGNNMQFYSSMRYSDKKITYKIYDCPLKKEQDMQDAFSIISNQTILEFYSTSSTPEIDITCDSTNKIEGGLFIAGEGGPVNITSTENFNVISGGKILLIRDSGCKNPNVAIHELLHALGFDHSANDNNIMYNVSKCDQTIGDDILEAINELYSVESYPDLTITNVSAIFKGKYLNTNFTVKNNGLKSSSDFDVDIYVDDELVKNIGFENLDVGYGRTTILSNLLVNQFSFSEVKYIINYENLELDKNDNTVTLKIEGV